MFTVKRHERNPILSPDDRRPFEASAAFNGCPVAGKDGKIHIVYRAMSEPDLLKEPHLRTSVVAAAVSDDGFDFRDRRPLVTPDREFDLFGCEDPRVTVLDGKYYIFYTALGGHPFTADDIKVAVAVSDDLETIREKHLVTPFNAKAMALFPGRVNGKMAALLTVDTDHPPSEICYAEFDRPEDVWSREYWQEWRRNMDAHKLSIRRLPDDQVELGAPPLKTADGWLVVYSHIQRYGKGDVVFGIEAVLLDLDNPRRIIGRTKGPFMVPEAYYEEVGQVPRIIFPSGAMERDGRLFIYYGAADTHCAAASTRLDKLISSMKDGARGPMKRFPGNPIITPRPGMLWEAKGTLNPAAVDLNGKIHLLYRAFSADNQSTMGYASSSDGFCLDERLDKPVYFPRMGFELPGSPGGGGGCEDPRLSVIGDRLYMTYAAYDGSTPRVAVSSISVDDFLTKRWGGWSRPEVMSPPGIADKDAAILPEPVKGGYMIFHRVGDSICADFLHSLNLSGEKITQCVEILAPRRGMWDGGKVGIAAPPAKTPRGWLLLYHGVSWSTTYRVGAVLLDLADPTVVLARTAAPLFEPEEEYERKGVKGNVVFPCGLVVRGNTAFMYYGAADDAVGAASFKVSELLSMLET